MESSYIDATASPAPENVRDNYVPTFWEKEVGYRLEAEFQSSPSLSEVAHSRGVDAYSEHDSLHLWNSRRGEQKKHSPLPLRPLLTQYSSTGWTSTGSIHYDDDFLTSPLAMRRGLAPPSAPVMSTSPLPDISDVFETEFPFGRSPTNSLSSHDFDADLPPGLLLEEPPSPVNFLRSLSELSSAESPVSLDSEVNGTSDAFQVSPTLRRFTELWDNVSSPIRGVFGTSPRKEGFSASEVEALPYGRRYSGYDSD